LIAKILLSDAGLINIMVLRFVLGGLYHQRLLFHTGYTANIRVLLALYRLVVVAAVEQGID